MPLQRIRIPSPNYSSRSGAHVRLIVLHTAEGATTYQSLGAYFANPSVQASSHTGIDDTPGVVGEYVTRDLKAWTSANANPVAVQTELCAFAAWSTDQWHQHPVMLQNCAQWIAEEAAAWGIPIRRLTAAEAQGGGTGVCQHNDLGAWGGGHWDCGPGFPIDEVLAMAQGGAPPAPLSTPSGGSEDSTMAVVTAPGRVDLFVIGTDRSIYQAIGTDPASLAGSGWMRIGGELDHAKTVSAAWTPDYTGLYLTVHGTDDRPYVAYWDGNAWSPFACNDLGQLCPDPYTG